MTYFKLVCSWPLKVTIREFAGHHRKIVSTSSRQTSGPTTRSFSAPRPRFIKWWLYLPTLSGPSHLRHQPSKQVCCSYKEAEDLPRSNRTINAQIVREMLKFGEYNSWTHNADDEAEAESSGALELPRKVLCSSFPIKKEHLSVLRCSWDGGVSALGCREVGIIGKHGQNPKLV